MDQHEEPVPEQLPDAQGEVQRLRAQVARLETERNCLRRALLPVVEAEAKAGRAPRFVAVPREACFVARMLLERGVTLHWREALALTRLTQQGNREAIRPEGAGYWLVVQSPDGHVEAFRFAPRAGYTAESGRCALSELPTLDWLPRDL